MNISYEWTDWHLTQDGWIPGSFKKDFNPTYKVAPPKNRVLTRRYIQEIKSISSPMKISRKNVWAIRNIHLIKKYFRMFEYPNTLLLKDIKIIKVDFDQNQDYLIQKKAL